MDDVSRAMHKAQEAVARITAGETPTTVPDRVAETPAAAKELVSDLFPLAALGERRHRRLARPLVARSFDNHVDDGE